MRNNKLLQYGLFILLSILTLNCTQPDKEAKSSEHKTEQKTQDDQRDVSEDPIVQKEPWKPRERLRAPVNDVERRIFEFQDSIERASYEDRINLPAIQESIRAMQEFGTKYPQERQAKPYLLRAADYAMGIREHENALEILDILLEQFDGSIEAADALYYKAYLYDRQLQEPQTALKLYRKFLDKYATSHDLTPQVQENINRLVATQK